MTSQANIIIAIVIVLIILAVVAIGVWRLSSPMSETDKVVLGCWMGEETNRANAAVKIGYLFWSGGNYTIVEEGFAQPVIERGKYTTSLGDNGTTALHLVPDKLGRTIANYPRFGKERTLSVNAQRASGMRRLQFDGGAIFINVSCESYTPQV